MEPSHSPNSRRPTTATNKYQIGNPEFLKEFEDRFSHNNSTKVCHLVHSISKGLNNKSFNKVQSLLDQLVLEISPITEAKSLQWLLCIPVKLSGEKVGQAILERTFKQFVPRELVESLVLIGASAEFSYSVKYRTKLRDGANQEALSEGNNLLHLAAIHLNVVAVQALARIGFPSDRINNQGLTPLSAFLSILVSNKNTSFNLNPVFKALLEHSSNEQTYAHSKHPLILALLTERVAFANEIAAKGFPPPIEIASKSFSIEEGKKELQVDYNRLVKTIFFLFDKVESIRLHNKKQYSTKDIVNEGLRLFGRRQNLHHLYLYLKSYLEMTDKIKPATGRAFTRLVAAITTSYSVSDISQLLTHFDAHQDHYYYSSYKQKNAISYHRNEAELLLLLAHRDVQTNFGSVSTGKLTMAITAPYRYYDHGLAKVNMAEGGWMTIKNWQRIGQLTHSFLNWKYDTIRPKDLKSGEVLAPSLAEDFGFRVVNRSSKDLASYGNTFMIRPADLELPDILGTDQEAISQDAVFFQSQSYLLVSIPNVGTLVIRNSSLVFGRDSMRHPAYFSSFSIENGFDYNELANLNSELLHYEFEPILSIHINGLPKNEVELLPNYREEIMLLLSQITAIINKRNSWIFDTNPKTAFRKSEGISHNDILGAYNSSGFPSLVRNLSHFHASSLALKRPSLMPDLVFVHPYNPPWTYYKFDPPLIDGYQPIQANKFKIDQFSLEVLQELGEGNFNIDDFENSGLRDFFQAGMDAEANLIMVA